MNQSPIHSPISRSASEIQTLKRRLLNADTLDSLKSFNDEEIGLLLEDFECLGMIDSFFGDSNNAIKNKHTRLIAIRFGLMQLQYEWLRERLNPRWQMMRADAFSANDPVLLAKAEDIRLEKDRSECLRYAHDFPKTCSKVTARRSKSTWTHSTWSKSMSAECFQLATSMGRKTVTKYLQEVSAKPLKTQHHNEKRFYPADVNVLVLERFLENLGSLRRAHFLASFSYKGFLAEDIRSDIKDLLMRFALQSREEQTRYWSDFDFHYPNGVDEELVRGAYFKQEDFNLPEPNWFSLGKDALAASKAFVSAI